MLHLFDGAAWVNIGPGTAGSGGGAFVGTSPPQNPASGALWWNGSALQVWDGTKWTSAGTVFEFAITQPGNATVGVDNAHYTAVPLVGVPVIDIQNAWNPATLRYTPNVAGIYQFQARSLNGGNTAGLVIAKNDPGALSVTSSDTLVAISSMTGAGWLSASGMTPMNGTTDYVRLFAYNASGTVLSAGANVVLGAYRLP